MATSAATSANGWTDNQRLIEAGFDRIKSIALQEMSKSYLYHKIMSAGEMVDIYTVKEVPVYTGVPASGTWYGRGDPLPEFSPGRTMMGSVETKYVMFPLGRDTFDDMVREGDPSIIFDQEELRAAEQAWAIRRTLSSAIFNGVGGKMPEGLSYMLEKALPAAQVRKITGFDKATNAFWRNQYYQLVSNFGTVAAGTTLPAGILGFLSLKSMCTIGQMEPSDFATTKAIWENFRRAMLEISQPQNFITERKLAEFGHKGFRIDGSDISWDPNCPADTIYALHLKNVKADDKNNAPGAKGLFDTDFEDIGLKSPLTTEGNLAIGMHPRVKMRKLAARSPLRQLAETSWIVTSFNLFMRHMARFGVAGSDNGLRWSTW